MDDTAKYLIHASITADGVVERSDVVGAVFGQTEGLLGDELDLRDLQQSSKVGRIDVEVDSENGQSFGHITIASSLDRVETSILAASLETITRVGPCQSVVEVTDIEDVREAKRREVVERAKELLAESFDGNVMESREILEEVRESVRVEDITEFHGLPAGPRVEDSDAIVVVEGRADVVTLLRYGIKNAVAVEGTNVPDAVARLTNDRTVTAFLDGDRGGELILRELAQVGTVDYVVFAPEGRSVEELARHEVMSALRGKVPYDTLSESGDIREAAKASTPGDRTPPPATGGGSADGPTADDAATDDFESDDARAAEATAVAEAAVDDPVARSSAAEDEDRSAETATGDSAAEDATLREHVRAVVDASSGRVRLLDGDFDLLAEAAVDEAFDAVADAETVPYAVVLDGEVTQRLVDVAAQRGVDQLVGGETAEFVKKPVSVRVRTAGDLTSGEAAEAEAEAD
ncbi:DNA primase DnaG [Salinirarus marinus]|uniref:DNA primase DnaG n=1 Tax=Salinirarus marinus TaxID=3068310 RepID=UPI003C6CA4BE